METSVAKESTYRAHDEKAHKEITKEPQKYCSIH